MADRPPCHIHRIRPLASTTLELLRAHRLDSSVGFGLCALPACDTGSMRRPALACRALLLRSARARAAATTATAIARPARGAAAARAPAPAGYVRRGIRARPSAPCCASLRAALCAAPGVCAAGAGGSPLWADGVRTRHAGRSAPPGTVAAIKVPAQRRSCCSVDRRACHLRRTQSRANRGSRACARGVARVCNATRCAAAALRALEGMGGGLSPH